MAAAGTPNKVKRITTGYKTAVWIGKLSDTDEDKEEDINAIGNNYKGENNNRKDQITTTVGNRGGANFSNPSSYRGGQQTS